MDTEVHPEGMGLHNRFEITGHARIRVAVIHIPNRTTIYIEASRISLRASTFRRLQWEFCSQEPSQEPRKFGTNLKYVFLVAHSTFYELWLFGVIGIIVEEVRK